MRTNQLLGLVARGIHTQSWQECQVAKAKKTKVEAVSVIFARQHGEDVPSQQDTPHLAGSKNVRVGYSDPGRPAENREA